MGQVGHHDTRRSRGLTAFPPTSRLRKTLPAFDATQYALMRARRRRWLRWDWSYRNASERTRGGIASPGRRGHAGGRAARQCAQHVGATWGFERALDRGRLSIAGCPIPPVAPSAAGFRPTFDITEQLATLDPARARIALMSTIDLPELFFAAGTLLSHHILERAEAVGAGGFSSTSCFVGDLLAWEADGRTIAELRDEMNMRGAPIDTVLPIVSWHPRWDPANPTGPAAKHGGLHVTATRDDAIRWADELGATRITTVGPWGGPDAPFEELVDALGEFADRAAVIGAGLQIEIVPTSKVPDVRTALALARGVGRSNVGLLLDTYNLCRGGVDLGDLDEVPLEMVFGLELADAAADAKGADYFDDALHWRLLPGDGDLDVAGVVARLAARGPLPACGFEVMSDELNSRPAREVGRIAGESTRAFIRQVLEDREGVEV